MIIMDITDLGGKTVRVITDDGQIFTGFVQSVETKYDADDGIPSIDLIDTQQFPDNIVGLKENEIVSIKEIST